ncbi:MAG: retention module-containing protein, partial [Acidobacteria bacterium]|nr:retention module-containing protein [Acidobacteriota bacterium]
MARAATHIWNGSTSSSFADSRNWTGGSPSGDTQAELVFPTGVANHVLTNDASGMIVHSILFDAGGYTLGGAALDLRDASITGYAANTISADAVLTGEVTVEALAEKSGFRSPTPLALTGVLSGSGSLTKKGAELLIGGGGSNTFAGGFNLVQGELWLGKKGGNAVASRFHASFATTVRWLRPEQMADDSPALFENSQLFLSGFVETFGNLTLSHTSVGHSFDPPVMPSIILAGDLTLQESTLSCRVSFGGTRTIHALGPSVIETLTGSPGASLVVDGSGNVQIGGTWDGLTVVRAREVTILNPTADVEVDPPGAVGGSVRSILSHGGTVGLLSRKTTVAGDVLLDAASTFSVATDSPFTVGGRLALRDAKLDLYSSGFVRGESVSIVKLSGTSAVEGTFAGIPEGGMTVSRSGRRIAISYRAGDGNDLSVTDFQPLALFPSVTISPQRPSYGGTVTVTLAAIGGASPTPLGNVTLKRANVVVAEGPVAQGLTYSAADFAGGTSVMTLSYAGDGTYLPFSQQVSVTVDFPVPVITTITPATLRDSGVRAVVVKGSGFVPESRLSINGDLEVAARYISPGELRFLWSGPRSLQQHIDTNVTVRNPTPGGGRSNAVTLTLLASPASTDFTFGPTYVKKKVTAGAQTVWATRVRTGSQPVLMRNVIRDTDGDGEVTWETGAGISTQDPWAVVDMSAGTVAVGMASESQPGEIPFPWHAFARDGAGKIRSLAIAGTGESWVVWARPGVGAWSVVVMDGDDTDLDRSVNGVERVPVAAFRPFNSEMPAAPTEFQRGDILVGLFKDSSLYFADTIDGHLDDPAQPAVVYLPYNHFSSVVEGTDYVVSVQRAGGEETVTSIDYATSDDSAKAGRDYVATAGTLTFAPGESLKTFTVPIPGNTTYDGRRQLRLTFSNLVGGMMYDVYSGVTRELVAPEVYTTEIVDDESQTSVEIPPDFTMNEGDGAEGTLFIPLTLTGPPLGVAATIDWTCICSDFFSDLSATPGHVVFQPGQTTQTLMLRYDAGTTPGLDRSARFFLTSNSLKLSRSFLNVTVREDDPPRVSITPSARVIEGNSGLQTVVLSVTLSSPRSRPLSLKWSTVDGSAMAGSDYVANSGTLDFAPFEAVKTIAIFVAGDVVPEATEEFFVRLQSDEPVVMLRQQGLVTIVDDDTSTLPTVSISDTSAKEDEFFALFTVSLSAPATRQVVVEAASSDGTAKSGFDYQANSGPVTFAVGEQSQVIALSLIDDRIAESDKTVFVTLSQP